MYAFKDFSHVIINEEVHSLAFIREYLIEHKVLNEIIFTAGSVLTLMLAIYLGFTITHKEKSIIGTFRTPKENKHIWDKLLDSAIIYVIFLFFLYFIFAVVMEWFALALDSLLVIAALTYYFVVYYILHTNRTTLHSTFKTLVHSVVSAGDTIIERYLELFHRRETILFALSGLIVISPLIDIGNFIAPYLLNMKKSFYLSALNPDTHRTLFDLIRLDLSASPSLMHTFANIFLYAQNTIFIVLILSAPFLIWLRIFNKKDVSFGRAHLALFYSGLAVYLLKPIYSIHALKNQPITGTDILTVPLGHTQTFVIAAVSLIWFIMIILITNRGYLKLKLEQLMTAVSIAFLGIYLYNFYLSTALYYIESIRYLIIENKYLLIFYLALYLVIITLFYISGFILYLGELLVSEHISYQNFPEALKNLMTVAWIFAIIFGYLILINVGDVLDLIILLLASTILSLSLSRYEKKIYSIVVLNIILIALFLASSFDIRKIDAGITELISRILLVLLSFYLAYFFKVQIQRKVSVARLIISSLLGVLFGVWFYVIKEPLPPIYSSSLLYIIVFSLLVAIGEEILFRVLFFGSLLTAFQFRTAIFIQGVVFGLLHFMHLKWFSYYLGTIFFIILVISLTMYGVLMGALANDNGRINPWYPVSSHALTIIVSLILTTFL
jgi:membrane protease YdiL (CAAX protease family)